MADGLTWTPGTGATIATDDAGAAGHVQLVKLAVSADGSATPIAGDADGVLVNLGANNDVTVTAITPGTSATNLGKAEDAVHASGDVGVMALAVRADTPAATGANGDYVALIVDSSGRLHVAPVIAGGPVAQDAAVSGNPVLVGVRASTATPTAMSADGDAVHLWADRRGALHTVPGAAGTATLSNVSASASSVQLLAANTSRKGLIVMNDSTADMLVKFGTTASSTSFTYRVPAGGTLELAAPIYTGRIDAIWTAANGAARCTELT